MDPPPTDIMSAAQPKLAQAVPRETLNKLAEKLKELVGEDFDEQVRNIHNRQVDEY
jgi:hypothetical protein